MGPPAIRKVEGMANILLVDDDPAVVADNVAALEADGHTVTAVPTTWEAFTVINGGLPDLVVMEAMLDGKFAGFDLARTLAHEYHELPLIMLTRADEFLSQAELDRQDCDGWLPVARYMEKPVAPDVLAYEVDHILEAGH